MRAPSFFIGHGSPMIAIQDIEFTQKLELFGRKLPQIDALLVISAHWVTKGIYTSGSEFPETIYDFYGFPKELYELKYPCPGSPQTAKLIHDTLGDVDIKISERGLDHGAWQVLRSIFPKANIPVLQLSINASYSFDEHFKFAEKLKFLREKNIAIMGSGNIVHNLATLDWADQVGKTPGWAKEFHSSVKKHLEDRNEEALIKMDRVLEYSMCAPTPEHFIPLLYAIGMMDKSEQLQFISEEFHHGTISMLSFCFRD